MFKKYNAEIVAGALLPEESRAIAKLIIDGVSSDEIDRMVKVENVLQKRSPGTAVRKAELIRKRLETLDEEMLQIVAGGGRQSCMQVLLIAAINHSLLIGDFLERVVKQRWNAFEELIKPSDWDDFLQECEQIDPSVKMWRPSTREKLGQVVKKCLVEAGYLESSRKPKIIQVVIVPEIKQYLMRTNNDYVIKSLDIFS